MRKKLLFRGTATALVTPFKKDGTVDEATLRDLVDLQLKGKTEALVPAGSTGEVAALSEDEQAFVIETGAEQAKKRVPVIGGICGDSTMNAIARAQQAKTCGVDAIVVPPPFSGIAAQEGLYRHYCTIADAAEFPIVIDNVFVHQGALLNASTVLRLARDVPFIVGVIEERPAVSMDIITDRPAGFGLWSGSDLLSLSLIALGADGAVSIVANEVPHLFSDLIRCALKGDWEKARTLHYRLLPLMKANMIEPDPAPVKMALSFMGIIEEDVRLPLVPLTEDLRPSLEHILADLHLLPSE